MGKVTVVRQRYKTRVQTENTMRELDNCMRRASFDGLNFEGREIF